MQSLSLFLYQYGWVIYYVFFPIYAIIDWRRTQKVNCVHAVDGAIFGFKRSVLAWALKMVAVYWLLVCLSVFLQTFLYMGNRWISSIHDAASPQTYISFQNKTVASDIISIGETNPTSKFEVYIQNGMIELQNNGVFWFNFIYDLLHGCLAIIFLVLLILIAHPISQKKPFTIQNVDRLRWLGVSVLALKGLEWLYQILCNMTVLQLYQFPSNPTNKINIHYNESNIVIILGLAIFIMAEIIQSGVELKNEQDLTV